MSCEGVGIGFRTAADAVAEVLHMCGIVLRYELHVEFHRSISVVKDRQLSAPAEKHLSLCPIELSSTVAIVRVVGGPKSLFVDQQSLAAGAAVSRVFERCLLRVGEFGLIAEEVLAPVC